MNEISMTIGIGTYWAVFCIIGAIVSSWFLPPMDNSSGGFMPAFDIFGAFIRVLLWGGWLIIYLLGVSVYLFMVKP